MLWTCAFTANTYLILAAAVWMGALGYFGWRRRNLPGARAFALLMALWAVCTIGMGFEAAAVEPYAQTFWRQYQFFWAGPLTLAGICFVLEYARLERFLTRPIRMLMAAYLLLGSLLIVTNNLQNWVWSSGVDQGAVIVQQNWAYWALANSGLLLMTLVNLPILVWLFIRSPLHRWPVALILFGQAIVRLTTWLDVINGVRGIESNFAVLGATMNALAYTIALFGLGMFNPLPLARQAAIALMGEGLVVLDPRQQIVDANPAAERILERPSGSLRGRPVSAALPCCHELAGHLEHSDSAETEISLGSAGDARHFSLALSKLKDRNEQLVGYLLLLHDISEQMRAKAKVVEQQRALATLEERERLARELHDSLGQALGYASFGMETVRTLLANGRPDAAGEQLLHLESIVAEAHADLREYILNLRAAPTDPQAFFPALQRYFDGYRQNYGIRVELCVEPGVPAGAISPPVQMQVLRIIQEALSNARKHGRAGCVQVSFAIENGRARIRIQDDGLGFDPQPEAGGDHYGLHFMRERAAQIGGSLRVTSEVERGTVVEVDAPCGS